MNYIIVAFTIRDKALTAYRLFVEKGVNAKLINTPRATGLGCGLSVQIEDSDKHIAENLLCEHGITTDGLFSVSIVNNKTIVARL